MIFMGGKNQKRGLAKHRAARALCLPTVVGGVLLSVFSLWTLNTEAYQIKRVVRGATTLASTAEMVTLDISSLLGTPLVELDPSKSFLLVTERHATQDRRISNFISRLGGRTKDSLSRQAGK